MISRYGMSEDFDMVAMENVTNQYLGGDSSLSCSFETQTLLDKKVVELVRMEHQKALKILQDNIGKLHELAKYLYEHETITGEEFMKILNAPVQVPHCSGQNLKVIQSLRTMQNPKTVQKLMQIHLPGK